MSQNGSCELEKGVLVDEFRLISRGLPLGAFEESLAVLQSYKVENVENPWRDLGNVVGPFMWDYRNRSSFLENLRDLYQSLIINYIDFVRGNELAFSDSPYMNPSVAIVYNIVDSQGDGIHSCPIIEELHIDNRSMKLPKVSTFIDGGLGSFESSSPYDFRIKIKGTEYNVLSRSRSLPSFELGRCPYLNGVYHLLLADLKEKYGYSSLRISRSALF